MRYNRRLISGVNIDYEKLVTPLMLDFIQQNIEIINIILLNTDVNYRHIGAVA